MTRFRKVRWASIACALTLTLITACSNMKLEDTPRFGTPCSTSTACGDGYRCSDDGLCVPGEDQVAILEFKAEPATLEQGQTTTLRWESRFAAELDTPCVIDQGVGPVPASGTVTAPPALAGTTTYTLTCSGAGSPASRTVDVVARPVLNTDFVLGESDWGTLQDVASIRGSLILVGQPIPDVATLQGVREVAGDLIVRDVPGLTALVLPSLEHVGGDIVFEETQAQSLELPALEDVGGDIVVRDNERLRKVHVGAATVGGTVRIGSIIMDKHPGEDYVMDNPDLEEIAFPNLTHVFEDFEIVSTGSIAAFDVERLAIIDGMLHLHELNRMDVLEFPSLETAGFIIIATSGAVRTVRFPVLASTSDAAEQGSAMIDWYNYNANERNYGTPFWGPVSFAILNDYSTTPIEALEMPALTSLSGEFVISETGLGSLELPHLEDAGGISLVANPQLQAVSAPSLSALTNAAGYLWLTGSGPIEFVAPNLAAIRGSLSVRNFASASLTLGSGLRVDRDVEFLDVSITSPIATLAHVGASLFVDRATVEHSAPFPALRTVAESLYVSALDTTTSEVEWPMLENVGGKFTLVDTDALASSAPVLASVGQLDIDANPALVDLSFPALTVIENDFELTSNPALPTLGDFCQLEEVGALAIVANDSLIDLSGLSAVRTTESLYITVNPNLPTCQVLGLADQIDGPIVTYTVFDNASPEATEACPLTGSCEIVDAAP